MKRSGLLSFLVAGIFVILQGCRVTYVETYAQPAAVDPYPNATYISSRVNGQLNQINVAVTQGNLDQDKGALLAQNDHWVSRLASDDRADNPDMDLSEQDTTRLDNMLNDNGGMIQDAIQNRQAWELYFQGNGFDYAGSGNSYIYLNYLDYQLNVQQRSVDAGLRSGQLSAFDAQILRGRIQSIRDAKLGYYRSNGRFDLSAGQAGQLSQMAADNEHYLQFRKQGHRGQWNQQKFSTWKSQKPEGLSQAQASQWGGSRNWKPQGAPHRGVQEQQPGRVQAPRARPEPRQDSRKELRPERQDRNRRGSKDRAPAAEQPAPKPRQSHGQAAKSNDHSKSGTLKKGHGKPSSKKQPEETPGEDDPQDSKNGNSGKGHQHPEHGQ